MKKVLLLVATLFVILALSLTSCGGTSGGGNSESSSSSGSESESQTVSVTRKNENATIDLSQVESFDYASLFIVTENGAIIETPSDSIDASDVKAEVGSYVVTCSYKGVTAQTNVTVTAVKENVVITETVGSISLKDKVVLDHNFKQYFAVTVNGASVEVTDEMIDKSALKAEEGSYRIYCRYKGKSEYIIVNVVETIYKVQASANEVTVSRYSPKGFDFKDLFSVSEDGVSVEVTDDMTSFDVVYAEDGKPIVGVYSYTVSYGSASATLTVNVTAEHEIEIINASAEIEIAVGEIDGYDFKPFFYFTVDGVAIEVTDDMIDASALDGIAVGDRREVSFAYSEGDCSFNSKIYVTATERGGVSLVAKNYETYPNADLIDLTTLFDIVDDGKSVKATLDMISGSVDYSKDGVNEITLTYKGKTATALVEVKTGVVINYATSSEITVRVGTNKDEYNFAKDFVVGVNGTRYYYIESYLDVSAVDFSIVGLYEAVLTVKYNKTAVGTGDPKFEEVSKTITYNVVAKESVITIWKDTVEVAKGSSFNPLSSDVLKVEINGLRQTLVTSKTQVNSICCYVEVKNGFNPDASGEQTIVLWVYVDGVDGEPTEVSYNVVVKSAASIKATNAAIFEGRELDVSKLFQITDGGKDVEVALDMITGEFNAFKQGTYYLTVEYAGYQATAEVVVCDASIIGTYKTSSVTAPTDGGEEDSDGYISESVSSKPIADLVIDEDFNVTANGQTSTAVKSLGNGKFIVTLGTTNEYTLEIEDGIAVLIPKNALNMQYSDTRRPLVYFSEDKYTIRDRMVVNYSTDGYVTTLSIVGVYSFDLARIYDREAKSSFWMGLKIKLDNLKTNDFYYSVEVGVVEMADGFVYEFGENSSFVFKGDAYKFNVESTTQKTALIDRTAVANPYLGKTYKLKKSDGSIDRNSTVTVGSNGAITYKKSGVVELEYSYLCASQAKYGGVSYDGIAYVYGSKVEKGSSVEYDVSFKSIFDDEAVLTPFAYKFVLDSSDKTFALVEKTEKFGLFATDNSYVFLDGYGGGIVNFNASSYEQTVIEYSVSGSSLLVNYVGTDASFGYGEKAEFNVDGMGNVLTAKETDGGIESGEVFESVRITDGAIVRFKSNVVKSSNDEASARRELLNNIQIITKDGELDYDQKVAITGTGKDIDLSAVKFKVAGFYQIKIKVSIGGEKKEFLYSVQVVETKYADSPFVGVYGTSVTGKTTMTINDAGLVTLSSGASVFSGLAQMSDDGKTFGAFVYSDGGLSAFVKGEDIGGGLIKVSGKGSLSIIEYFTKGSVDVAGIDEYVVRRVLVDGTSYYYVAPYESSIGTLANAVVLSGSAFGEGSVISLTVGGKTTVVKIKALDDVKNGLEKSDSARGEYSSSDGSTLVLDGFASFNFGSVSGTYFSFDNYVVAESADGQTLVFEIDSANKTFVERKISINANLLVGKTFSATYTFPYEDEMLTYTANTRIEFKAGGKVSITSTSSDYGEDGDEYGVGTYSPSFVGEGTYTVSNGVVTVTVGGATFTFKVTNPIEGYMTIKCLSTTIEEGADGYFAVGSSFSAN